TGRGSSMDIIEASAKAYLQALNKVVLRSEGRPARRRAKRVRPRTEQIKGRSRRKS
ncbi:MAG: hypothetical protein JSV79_02320, partial [Armatimonadota bacterium]